MKRAIPVNDLMRRGYTYELTARIFSCAVLLCLAAAGAAVGEVYRVKRTGQPVKLKPGDTALHAPSGYRVTFGGYRGHTSDCAVPGKNCGAGYFPGTLVLPDLKLERDDKCKAAPQPESCEITHKTVNHEKEGYLLLSFVSVFSFCEAESNEDNKTSCYIRTVRNGPSGPPFRPENCERLKAWPERRDACYESAADKLGDHRVCDKITGVEGFQCVYLRAQAAGDPGICRTLKRGRLHHTEQDLRDQVQSCLNTVRRQKPAN